jgi:HipA-like C-terminal domain
MFELWPRLLDGARAAGELTDRLGVSRATLKLAYDRESASVLRLGRARSTRYAARQVLTGLGGDEFPVFRVDETGKIAAAGRLVTLAAGESVWLPEETILDGLPAEMHDVAPKGFLGRSFTRRHADLGLPDSPANWSDHHVLTALSRRGEDLPGNLVIGRESFDRFQALQHEARSEDDFPALAEAAAAGEHAGSSAGGEQPKFTVLLGGGHRIVKFATNETDNARRWQDLLALEHVALEFLTDAGIAAAKSRLVDVDGLRCLVVDRYDRVDRRGRRAVITMAAVAGRADEPWTDVADALTRQGRLNETDRHRIAVLDAFGAQIANTDRHPGNIAFFPDDDGLSLAPAYDQLPMAYSPPASGHLPNLAVNEARPTVGTLDAWDEARAMAAGFWQRAAGLSLTDSMRRIVAEHARRYR